MAEIPKIIQEMFCHLTTRVEPEWGLNIAVDLWSRGLGVLLSSSYVLQVHDDFYLNHYMI